MSENQIYQKSSQNSKGGGEYLSLLLAVAFLLFITKTAFPLLLTMASGIGGWILWKYTSHQSRHRQECLDRAFYSFIREHGGLITPLDLALVTQLPGSQVQAYLDSKAVEFGADFEITEDGRIFYTFSTVATLTKTNEPKSPVSGQVVELPPVSMNQTELAKRFDVHPNTLRRWKYEPQFQRWSSQKDPDAIPWEYSEETRQFHPREKFPNITELMERNRLGDGR